MANPLAVGSSNRKKLNMKLLHIDSSILGDYSVSRQLTAEIVALWVQKHPGTSVEHLDLAVNAPSHFGADAIAIKGIDGAIAKSDTLKIALKDHLNGDRNMVDDVGRLVGALGDSSSELKDLAIASLLSKTGKDGKGGGKAV